MKARSIDMPPQSQTFSLPNIGLSSRCGVFMHGKIDQTAMEFIGSVLSAGHQPRNPISNFWQIMPTRTLLAYRGCGKMAFAEAACPYYLPLEAQRLVCCTEMIEDAFWYRLPDVSVTFSRWLVIDPGHAADLRTLSVWMSGVDDPNEIALSAAAAESRIFGELRIH